MKSRPRTKPPVSSSKPPACFSNRSPRNLLTLNMLACGARPIRLATVVLVTACVISVGATRHPDVRGIRLLAVKEHLVVASGPPPAAHDATYADENRLTPPFQTAIRVETVPRHSKELALLEVIMLNEAHEDYDNAQVACDTCHWSDDNFVPRGDEFIDQIRPPRLITNKSHLVISTQSLGRIGRYRLYAVRPRPNDRSTIPEIAQGCIPTDAWPAFLTITTPSVFTTASLNRTQPTTPCNFTVPTGDSLRITAPATLPTGSSADVTVSGSTSGPRMLTVTVQTFPTPCPNAPLGDLLYPGSGSEIPLITSVDGTFDMAVAVRGQAGTGEFCAFLQTPGEFFDGYGPASTLHPKLTPDGRLTRTTIANWTA